MEYKLKRISTAGIPEAIAKARTLTVPSTNRKKQSRSVAIFWSSSRSINSHCVCSVSLFTDQFHRWARPIAAGKRKRTFHRLSDPL